MSRDEAREEALRRWPGEGYAWGSEPDCVVGLEDGGAFEVKGWGETWEEAFTHAESYKKKGKRR